MIGKSIKPELEALIEARDFSTIREVLDDLFIPDIAEILSDIEPSDTAVVFRLLPKSVAAETFEYLDLDAQKDLLQELAHEQVIGILNEMHPDDRTALLEELPGTIARDLIARLSAEERHVARTLLGYPEESVGRLMTPDYVAVREDWTVREVLDHIRGHGKDSETLDVIYIVDAKGRLIDDIRIREILFAPLESTMKQLGDERYVSLQAFDDQESCVSTFGKYDRFALPVLDRDGVLLGIVTIDDVLNVAEEEHTEDIQKFGGVSALEAPYASVPILTMVRKRAIWLVVLFLGELLTATAMQYFADHIARAVILAMFVPLIISSGGNTGSQAATLIIRAMALGEITLKDWWSVMHREILSGLLLGLILGTIGFVRIMLWTTFTDIYGEHWELIGLTVGLSLLGVVLWGTISGSMLPFILQRFGIDPATSSAPFVATIVDVTGIVIYFGVAVLLLTGTLL